MVGILDPPLLELLLLLLFLVVLGFLIAVL
jgi:hypothetical protein